MKDETCELNERIGRLEERLVIAATSVIEMIESLNQRLEDALRRIAEIEAKQKVVDANLGTYLIGNRNMPGMAG